MAVARANGSLLLLSFGASFASVDDESSVGWGGQAKKYKVHTIRI